MTIKQVTGRVKYRADYASERLTFDPGGMARAGAQLLALDTRVIYDWDGETWVIPVPQGGGGMEQHGNEWHTPDFLEGNTTITPATKTKITYDAKGLVTAGADATPQDVGAEPAGAVATHASVATGIHGVGASTVESASGSASKVSAHAGVTSAVHGFDSSGNAPAQAHGNTRHTSTFVTQTEIDSSITVHAGAADPHTGYQKESEKAAANGYAGLDATVKVPTIQLGGAGADNTKYLRGDQTWVTPTAAAADPSYSPGSFTVATETSRTYGNHLKLTTTQRATVQGTGRLRVIN